MNNCTCGRILVFLYPHVHEGSTRIFWSPALLNDQGYSCSLRQNRMTVMMQENFNELSTMDMGAHEKVLIDLGFEKHEHINTCNPCYIMSVHADKYAYQFRGPWVTTYKGQTR